jgi:DNA-binding NarL/FixJ family response regulator
LDALIGDNCHMKNQASSPGLVGVAVIEDRLEIRDGLKTLISSTEGYRCAGAYSSMEDALRDFLVNPPQVALVDIGLPGMSGLEGIRTIRKRFPRIRVLMLTIYEDDDRIFEALCAGACGYLLKAQTSPTRLIEAVGEVVAGGAPMSSDVAKRVISLFQKMRPPDQAEYDLTPHEMRILRLLVEGHNYRTLAAELKVSVNTVAFHIKSIYEKLEVHSKSEAVSKALRNRLVF